MNELFQKLASLSPERRALFEKKLLEKGLPAGGKPAISRRSADTAKLPLSFAQQRLWFMQQLEPDNSAYNIMNVLKLQGKLDQQALSIALSGLVARHELLRTRYILGADGQPEQIVEAAAPIDLEMIDLQGNHDAERAAQQHIELVTGTPYDLTKPPLRIRLLKLANDEHLLVFATHHIASDRWSAGIFVRELSALYRKAIEGDVSPLPPLQLQYADWAIWQRQTLDGDTLERQLSYWKDRLSGELPVLDLPFDRPREATAGVNGAQYPVRLDTSLSMRLRDIATRNRVSLFTLLLTAFKVLLHRYTDSDDIIVGSEVANRDRAETQGMIGPLVNTLVLRNDLSGNPGFETLLAKVNEVVRGGLVHQDTPFERIVEAVNPERRLNELTPLFQAKFDLQHGMIEPFGFSDLTLEYYPLVERTAKYELRFNLQDHDPDIGGRIEYCSDLFDEATIVRMLAHYETLLRAIAEDSSRSISSLPLMDENEKQRTLQSALGPVRDYPVNLSIHQLFEQQVDQRPNAEAVTDGITSFTYGELNQRANSIAAALLAGGENGERCIGVCMRRTPQLIAALLGILKAGAAFVPLDPDYPSERLSFIAKDAALDVVICDEDILPFVSDRNIRVMNVTANLADEVADLPAVPQDRLAYIIYTSGSTGLPKGVAIEHRSAVARMYWAQEQFGADELSGMLAATSICFDLSVFEIFAPLSWGGKVILAENLLALPHLPVADEVTLVNTVPSLLRELLKHTVLPANVRTVNLAGEPFPPALLKILRDDARGLNIYNLYGPSEDTTYSTGTAMHGKPAGSIPIGSALPNTRAYILDRNGQLQPDGLAGELYLGGAGLARGYFGRPEQTSEKFLIDTVSGLPGQRLYRTGDRVRRRPDGEMDFLGRSDHQVKIRGFRIETGEIEYHLEQHPDVQEAIVVVTGKAGDSDRQLVAYAAPRAGSKLDETALRSMLAERLPSHLVPTRWCILSYLPHLPNGKIDRSVLPSPVSAARTGAGTAPRSASETCMMQIWADVLETNQIGIDDNFFDLGGHSLLAIRIIARIETDFGVKLPLKALFRNPTIAALVEALPSTTEPASEVEHVLIVPNPAARNESFPLTDIQHAYWMGRNRAFELGSVGAHGYREFDADGLEIAAVQTALQKLIERHDMLRAIVESNGTQRILQEVPAYEVASLDLRGVSDREVELAQIRQRLSHEVFNPQQWPLFHVEAARLSDKTNRYFISFDVLIGDAWSFQLLGNELAALLAGRELPELSITFRDYVLAEQAQQQLPAFKRSLAHWQDRLVKLPPAPELPLARALSQINEPHFERRTARLSAEDWSSFKARAAAFGLTPTTAIMAAFSEVLARWSRRPSFTLNLTLFNRQPWHPEVNRVVGDFTASMLLGIELSDNDGFGKRAQRIQDRLLEDLDHRAVSGVRVLRELTKKQNRTSAALMPVVFTSTLSQAVPGNGPRSFETRLIDSVSQTPQVYLDHQAGEIDGELVFNWDAIEELFPAGLLDAMFGAYRQFIHDLAIDEAPWHETPKLIDGSHFSKLNAAALLPLAGSDKLLHQPFFEIANRTPDRIAIISNGKELTYREVAERSLALAADLQTLGAERNCLVAVSLEKGADQTIACLAILAAGAAYVPIDPDLPRDRRWQLIEDTEARIVITAENDWPGNISCIAVPTSGGRTPRSVAAEPTDLAYVIFTSGSTGKPKGVMIDHRGAVNTILDINRRFDIGEDDRTFALSSLSFDLSVYDIFGPLSLGGAVVVPTSEETANTARWRDLLLLHGVTVWNSVPALAQLLATELAAPGDRLPVRLVMMSGDWIPVSLPDTLRSCLPAAEIMSLGGATEASIWSIYYPVGEVASGWTSIPYGYPLANQRWYVLNDDLQPCPPWVTGKLFIGGIGVARGYWNRPSLTADRFIPDHFASPEEANNGAIHLYDTGDLGRYRADGALEFLGREDFQVKVNGFRIELGEIEAALLQHPSITEALVAARGTPPALVAYFVPKDDKADAMARFAVKAAKVLERDQRPSGKLFNLPSTDRNYNHIARQSHRNFLKKPVSIETFAGLLEALRSQSVPSSPLSKYAYPSAGSLYPVETWALIKENRISGIDAGWYRYDSSRHDLEHVAPYDAAAANRVFGDNAELSSESAFALFMIASMSQVRELYGEKAESFSMLEAGYMGQLLMASAPAVELGLCPLGGIDREALSGVLGLDRTYLPLHALCGGGIDPAWSENWQAVKSDVSGSIQERIGAFLSKRLPSYMIPRDFIRMESLPHTANGKVDRQALPEPDTRSRKIVEPATPVERQIVDMWRELLEVPDIGAEDHFFEVGGNSLTAMRLMTQLQQSFAIELSITQLFGALTPRAQADLIANAQKALPSASSSIPAITRHDSAETLPDEDVDAMLAQLMSETVENAS